MRLVRLMVSSKKGALFFMKRGICMKSIAGVLAVTLNLLILTLIWGFAYLHAYTDALSSTYWAEKYRYLSIPLIVVIIASMLIELGIIYQKELAAYFHWNTKETKGQ